MSPTPLVVAGIAVVSSVGLLVYLIGYALDAVTSGDGSLGGLVFGGVLGFAALVVLVFLLTGLVRASWVFWSTF